MSEKKRPAGAEGKARGQKIKVSGQRSGGQQPSGQQSGGQPPSYKPRPSTKSEHQPSSYRLFYALTVPAAISAPLVEAQGKLRGNWRRVEPGQMHVTLSYLPTVPPEKVEDLKRLGVRLTQDIPPLRVRLRGTGYFPNEGSPRVWFVRTEAEGLSELAENLRAGIQELGVQTDDLPFKAHITLARKKGPAPRLPPLTFEQEWTAPALTLYRSILRKTGPIYEVQSTFRLRGTTPPTRPEAPSPLAARGPLPLVEGEKIQETP